jgi:F0F1-type ATP synthase assembly protein I
MNKIKKTITNIMITTGAALLLLAVFSVINGGESIYNETFFQVFGANIVIHLGLILTKKFESTFAVLEFLLDISYTIAVLVIFGLVFDWFFSIPIWYLVVMAVVVYTFGFFNNIVRIHKNADELNKLLQKHKNKNSNSVI